MTRTKRFYNKPNNYLYVHPYREICMGHCRACRNCLEKGRHLFLNKGWTWATKRDYKRFRRGKYYEI